MKKLQRTEQKQANFKFPLRKTFPYIINYILKLYIKGLDFVIMIQNI